MNLSGMSIADLRNLQEQVKHELKKRESQEVAKAREQIFAIAHSVGVPLKELIAGNTRVKTGKVAMRYRHPADASLQWTGRGRQPKWVKDWTHSGQSIDLLRI